MIGNNMIDPKEDGVSHINIYSKGRTELGRFLSNFADCDIETEDGYFRTIEGYWYWLSLYDKPVSHVDHSSLRHTNGFESKRLGRKFGGDDWPTRPDFQSKILKAIAIKIMSHPDMLEKFIKSSLPFQHYYVYNDKVIVPKEGLWMISFISEFRDELQRGNSG